MMKQKCGKRMLVLLMMLCICLMCGIFMTNQNSFNVQTASAETSTESIEENLTFNVFNNGTEYRVTSKNRQATEVKIPYEYNGLPVTEIADNAFLGCTNLKKVWIPYSVIKIGENAFANCRNLEEIIGMSRVQIIGNNAFV